MEIRRAVAAELPAILAIYADARRFMAEHGNPRQWGGRCWPPEALIRRDIAAGKSYVCEEDGRLLAVFYFDTGERPEPGYDVIREGRWIGAGPYGVVHRIAVAVHRRGAASFCLAWALSQCGDLRIDTHPDNTVMQALLQKAGFICCGLVQVAEDGVPRLAYEKLADGAGPGETAQTRQQASQQT